MRNGKISESIPFYSKYFIAANGRKLLKIGYPEFYYYDIFNNSDFWTEIWVKYNKNDQNFYILQ